MTASKVSNEFNSGDDKQQSREYSLLGETKLKIARQRFELNSSSQPTTTEATPRINKIRPRNQANETKHS